MPIDHECGIGLMMPQYQFYDLTHSPECRFASHINKGFVIQVFQTARLDVVLNVGTVSESVQVTSALPLLQSENASVGQVISTQAINELPLNGRHMSQLAIIAPGGTGLNYRHTGTIGWGAR